MFHVELFSSSIASGANTLAQVNYAAVDRMLPPAGNGVQVSPTLPYLFFVAGVSANLVHIRPTAPSFLPTPRPHLNPNNRGTAFESPPRVWDFSSAPLALRPTEEFDIFATQNAGAGQTPFVLVGFTDRIRNPIPPIRTGPTIDGNGAYFSAHWTTSTTLTASAWSLVTPVFDDPLPAGFYSLIGARVFSASALFFRMYPAQTPNWRPGGIAVQAYDQLDPVNQRGFQQVAFPSQGWGEWLHFFQNVPPQVQIFATAADTAEEGWFDLVKISDAVTQA